MGAVIRLTDDITKWLKTIDNNPHEALRIVQAGYTAHKDLEAQHEQIKETIRELKQ